MTVLRPGPGVLAVSGAVLGALLLASCGSGASGDDGPPTARDREIEATEQSLDPESYAGLLVAETNAVRDAEGVPALEESPCATDEARRRAEALVGVRLEHAPLDAVVAACAPAGGVAAENLSRAAATPADVVDAWMGSHGHRANLLDPTLREVGVACVADPSEGHGALVCAEVFLG